MQRISKFKKGIRFLLCVIGIYSKYAWIVLLKDKKFVTIVSAFQNILHDLMSTWVDKKVNFITNQRDHAWLKDNDIKIHSTNNEGKTVVAARFIRTF